MPPQPAPQHHGIPPQLDSMQPQQVGIQTPQHGIPPPQVGMQQPKLGMPAQQLGMRPTGKFTATGEEIVETWAYADAGWERKHTIVAGVSCLIAVAGVILVALGYTVALLAVGPAVILFLKWLGGWLGGRLGGGPGGG